MKAKHITVRRRMELYDAAIAQLEKQNTLMLSALRFVASRGGNLPDDSLTDKTGPNDARSRGLMYVECRDVARKAIKDAESLTSGPSKPVDASKPVQATTTPTGTRNASTGHASPRGEHKNETEETR